MQPGLGTGEGGVKQKKKKREAAAGRSDQRSAGVTCAHAFSLLSVAHKAANDCSPRRLKGRELLLTANLLTVPACGSAC